MDEQMLGINAVIKQNNHPQTTTNEEDNNNYIKTYNYDTPIVDIVNNIIIDSINRGASDIHFDPEENGIKIRIRIDGDLHNYTYVPLEMKKNLITRIKIISNMNITESRLPQDGAIKGSIENVEVDLRVSCLPTNQGEKVVIRILDYTMSSQGLENLGFTKENYDAVSKMLSMPNGMILVTGATGSGKSTTVYSMLQKLNTENRNIVTVEDPIEMNIEGINQVQVNSEIGMTFSNALRSILRQDPDIIMIGEIRDSETAKIAVRSAITGHLVLSTLHTNDSLSTIERLIDMNVERYLLGSAISGIISQKLARELCPKCKKVRNTTEYEKKIFKKALNANIETVYEPCGCDECNDGYKERIPIHEILIVTQDIKDAIANNINKSDLKTLVFKDGSMSSTMLQDGLKKVILGDTSFDEIMRLIEIDEDTLDMYEDLPKLSTTEEEKENELETFEI